jgi:hypothetical protein
VRSALGSLCLLGAFCIVVAYCQGCGPTAGGLYTADHLNCVDQAETKAESRACREEVRRRWKQDGGTDAR